MDSNFLCFAYRERNSISIFWPCVESHDEKPKVFFFFEAEPRNEFTSNKTSWNRVLFSLSPLSEIEFYSIFKIWAFSFPGKSLNRTSLLLHRFPRSLKLLCGNNKSAVTHLHTFIFSRIPSRTPLTVYNERFFKTCIELRFDVHVLITYHWGT